MKQIKKMPVVCTSLGAQQKPEVIAERSLDLIYSPGCYAAKIDHTSSDVGLPLGFCSNEHYYTATLIVTESGTDGQLQNNRMIGQTLILPACDDGRTRIFARTQKKVNGNHTWSDWRILAQTGMDDEITNTEELVASVTELMSQTEDIKTNLLSETVRTQEAEASINKNAILSGSLNINPSTDSVTLAYRNIDGSETSEVDIPAATTEKAGVMSAEDKGWLSSIGVELGSSIVFEQGTVSAGEEIYATNRVRNTRFICPSFFVKVKEDYRILRVVRYSLDGTYKDFISVGTRAYTNLDASYKYRLIIIREDEGDISPNDDFLEEFNAGIDYVKSHIKSLSYVNMTAMFRSGYYKTSEIGSGIGDLVNSTVRKHVIATNLNNGDVYIIKGTGGSTGVLHAKVKDGIIISSGNSSSEATILCDGSFDTLVFNIDTREQYYLYAYLGTPNVVISEVIEQIKEQINDLQETIVHVGSTSIALEQGTIYNGVEQGAENRVRTELINTGFLMVVKDGFQIYRLIEYNKDGTYIRHITLNKEYAYVPNNEGLLYRVILSKSNINNPISPSEDIIEEYADGLRFTEKQVATGNAQYGKFFDANIVVIGDSAVAASDWAGRMCNDIKCNKYLVSAAGGQTLRTRYKTDGSMDNCLRKNLENSIIPGIDSNWDGKVDIIMIQEGGNDIGNINGDIESAFSNTNYLAYKEDSTTYGSLRYCLELIKRKYPSCLVTMGTVFGRRGENWTGNAESINNVIIEICQRLGIQVIDGNKYCGFAPILEPIVPYYGDGAPGVVGGGGTLSRELPAYNYVDADNNIVDYETATDNGVLKEGYSKRYGLYTYDGKHQNLQGEEKVLKFMKAELDRLYTK